MKKESTVISEDDIDKHKRTVCVQTCKTFDDDLFNYSYINVPLNSKQTRPRNKCKLVAIRAIDNRRFKRKLRFISRSSPVRSDLIFFL